ncbi:tRNA pseudouridine(55) synthase TruB [candidate division KSB1 bacterium]
MDQKNQRNTYKFQEGAFFLINKPLEWTSFDVVNYFRKFLRSKFNINKIKVGHAGTLDPMASGLLILCTGKYTKKISEFQSMAKEYEGTINIGASTPSYDTETPIDNEYDISHISEILIRETTNQFIGPIMQIPPIFSAVKVKGKKAYDYARKQETIELKPRSVTINKFEIISVRKEKYIEIDFIINCSKGTYIRSLAHDFGKAINSGAHLASLCRTKIGDYSLNDALILPDLINKITNDYGKNSEDKSRV